MLKVIGSSIALAGLLLGAGQPAQAHNARQHGYDSHGHHQHAAYRDRQMPRWLWKKKGFRRWYFRTPPRLTNRLAWPRLYDAYRWERQHDFRRSYWRNYGPQDHRYDRDRRNSWDDKQHKRRAKRHRIRNL